MFLKRDVCQHCVAFKTGKRSLFSCILIQVIDGNSNVEIQNYEYQFLYYCSYTVIFLYLASLYLAEANMIMPSPRNHISEFFSLAAALSGNGQSTKSKLLTTSTSLIPTFKTRPRQRPSFKFRMLLAIITSLILQFKIRTRQWPDFELC